MHLFSTILFISLVGTNICLETKSDLFTTYKSIKICTKNLEYVSLSPTTPCIFLCLSSEDCVGFNNINSTASKKTCLLVKNDTCEEGILGFSTTVTQDVWIKRQVDVSEGISSPINVTTTNSISRSDVTTGNSAPNNVTEINTTPTDVTAMNPTYIETIEVTTVAGIRNCTPAPSVRLTNCLDIYNYGYTNDGVYPVCLNVFTTVPTDVYCDMQTDGGGYLVFQKRYDGSVDFYRNWTEYANGFGNPATEYWLGNKYLHNVTSTKIYRLMIELEGFDGYKGKAIYDRFVVNSEADKFSLYLSSAYSGNIPESFLGHQFMKFSTYDQDNDKDDSTNCAEYMKGGWWFNSCYEAHLNGQYKQQFAAKESDQGILWMKWTGIFNSLKKSEMKIKPLI